MFLPPKCIKAEYNQDVKKTIPGLLGIYLMVTSIYNPFNLEEIPQLDVPKAERKHHHS